MERESRYRTEKEKNKEELLNMQEELLHHGLYGNRELDLLHFTTLNFMTINLN